MNGSRCRLRDIEEMFASTGLTQQGYAVVAQDDVDHIIQTTASDRRALIPEGAGVRRPPDKRHGGLATTNEPEASNLRPGGVAAPRGPGGEERPGQPEAPRPHQGLET